MGKAIGEILPLAVALAAGPLPIIGIVLILVSDNAKAKGVGFVFGRIAGLVLAVAIGALIFKLINDPSLGQPSQPRPAVSVARIVIGVVLIAMAARKWHRRDEPAKPSPISRRVEGLTVRGSVGMGVMVSVVDPSSVTVGILCGLDIAAARQAVSTSVIVTVCFIALSTLSITVPLIGYLVGGSAARDRLQGMKRWLTSNEDAVMMVLFLVVGAMLIGRGIRDLAGV